MNALSLMVQGTASSVGKSLLVTALCRIFSRRGIRTAPFKAQNMSLNAFVTEDGGEMGRAQAVQAEAAGILPDVRMNPVLLKPSSDRTSQVILNGRAQAVVSAREYHTYRAGLREPVLEAYRSLASDYDLIILEGAGSPAEINLREHDLANMGIAEPVDAPVVLVGDIDRGGVFAALYGTIALLEKEEQARIQGIFINKFRGDKAILEPGLVQLEALTQKPVLGVLPYLAVSIDEEDSAAPRIRSRPARAQNTGADLDIAVLRLPRLSNFTDFAVFDTQPDVCLRYVDNTKDLGLPDMLIIPGSKSTLADLRFLNESGLADAVRALHARKTCIIGICGGYQILGRSVHDPLGTEGAAGSAPGLGLLNAKTHFAPGKNTAQAGLRLMINQGIFAGLRGMELTGYEIHMGETRRGSDTLPFARYTDDSGKEGFDGAVNEDGTVAGTYLHGLFDNIRFTRALLNALRAQKGLPPAASAFDDYRVFRETEYDRLADSVEEHTDMAALQAIITGRKKFGA